MICLCVLIDSELMELVSKAFKESLTIQQQQVTAILALMCNTDYNKQALKAKIDADPHFVHCMELSPDKVVISCW